MGLSACSQKASGSVRSAVALAAGGPVPDQVIFPILACEGLREDGSDEAGIVELDREIGAVIAGPLAPGRTDLRIADIDPVAGRIAAVLFVRDVANRFCLNRASVYLRSEVRLFGYECVRPCRSLCLSFH